jgi:hypothetical protein
MEARKMALDKIYKRRNRYDIPEWQRGQVWSDDRKQLLIDSILRGWKLPKLYFAKTSDDPDEFDVVDGQQRLSAIFDFFGGELSLSGESAARFGGGTYEDLGPNVTDRFDDFEIEYDEITEATDEELQLFFQRLQGGMNLTSAERLNSIGGKLTVFCRSLAKHSFFKHKVAIRDTRMAYFDIASKAAAIEIEGLDAGLRFDDLKAIFESQASFSASSKVAQRLRDTLKYLDKVFPKKSPVLRNRSTIQSFITLTAKIVESEKSSGNEARLRTFFEDFGVELARQVELGQKATDPDYLEFQRTLSANVKAGAKTRHTILLRKLLLSDPIWTDILGPGQVALSGLAIDIDRIARSIADLITNLNEQYSSQHGTDLFKSTNKTTPALARLRIPIADFSTYSNLIDDLYFIFHEGPGNRLGANVPASFEDVNLLRTGLQHDLDHGKAGASAAKRKKIGETFAKYAAGATTPTTLAPERFPMVQAILLKALETDLRKLDI